MKKSKFSEEQIATALRQVDAGAPVLEVTRKKKQLWGPEGFVHGFLVLSDHAEVLYKTTDYWSPQTSAVFFGTIQS